ncbi:YihY/virulence factor BrkB family protein [Vallicoccus soli]|uniref:YihY/virulence factor BrkB family protein n=1 Tax=Vallicoccus soli TaxID=2339232 RepID=A0A3A3ZNI0_9ACTN|nr:YihY/virulence factor BrkB family protein [Vallicoccus soli]
MLRSSWRGLHRQDLALTSAGVTFYAGIAVVPSLLVALWAASLMVGRDRLLELADSLAAALPGGLGAPAAAQRLVEAAVGLHPLTAVVAAVPATLYGEGLRRAFVTVSGVQDAMTGWRGRLRVAPLFAVTPLLALAVLLATPTLAELFSDDSLLTAALGVYVALNVDWVVLSLTLTYVYLVVGPRRPSLRAALWGGWVTGAFVSGFVQGFVLFLALPVDLGAPFGGLTVVGAVVALGFWLWLLHGVTLLGYSLTWRVQERGGVPWGVPRLEPRPAPAPGASALQPRGG